MLKFVIIIIVLKFTKTSNKNCLNYCLFQIVILKKLLLILLFFCLYANVITKIINIL